MMVLSAFVAIPTYNARADHDNHDDHDHDDHGDDDDHGLPSFSDLDENGNGTIEFSELLAICPEDQSDEQCRGIFDQYSGDDDVIDEDEYQTFVSDVTGPGDEHHSMMVCYNIDTHEVDFSITSPEDCQGDGLMWVSTDDGPDRGDDDWNLENLHAHLKMESLSEWLVTLRGEFSGTDSDMFRQDVSEMCENMMGTNEGEITQECYDHWAMMMENDDTHDDHGGHDGWSCPPGLTDDECDMMEDCQDNDMAGMSCQRMLYDYCNDNPGVCDFDDGDSNFFFVMFAYEDGDITAEEFLSNGAIESMFDDMFDDGDGTDGGPSYDWGQGKYDLYTFTSETDGKVVVHPEFIHEFYESPNFICGNGNAIPFQYVNDYYADCEDGADEQWYDSNTPNDTSDDCQKWDDDDCVGDEVNWFDCHDGTKVWIAQVNNDDYDCEDGEDEYRYVNHYWYGEIYLLSGEFTGDSLGTELTPDHEGFMAASEYICNWRDDNKTSTDCNNALSANLVTGDTYTLVTVGHCDSFDGEMDCARGNYMHTMQMEDGTSMNISGNITHDHPMADFSEVMQFNDGSILGNFVLYDERAFTVGEDGFEGMFVSYATDCYDYDRDGEYNYCYGSSPSLYLYENFDSSDTESGLVGSVSSIDDFDESECPDHMEKPCMGAMMGIELTPGDYTLVTTFDGNYEVLYTNMVQTTDGTTVSEWDGKVHNAYYISDNGTETLVEGNDRIYMPYPEYDFSCYDDDNEIDCDDMFEDMALLFDLADNMTAYEDGDMNATMAADNILEILNAMVDEGFFDHGGDHHDDHYVDWIDWSYCEWEGDNFEGDTRWYCTDEGEGSAFDDWWYYCEAHDDGMNGTNYFCTDDFGQSPDYENSASNDHYVTGGSPNGDHHDDHHNDHYDHHYDEGEGHHHHGDEDYHHDHDDDDTTSHGSYDRHHDHHDDHNDHGDHDDREDDDNPPLLDGIVGVQTSSNNEDCLPSADTMVGMLSDNEGKPLVCYQEFKFKFEGVDNTKDSHVAFIPFEDDDEWTLEVEVLEGYEVTSCDSNCMMNADGTMTGTGPTNVTFSKKAEEEPQPDCDYVVGLSADGMAFDPVKLSIKAGETVCWQWKDAAMAHNVLELEGEYDASMNLTSIDFGFSSGEPAMTVDYRHTFTEDNKIHYYVCEPHAQLGMVGQITVGNGTEDPVQQTLEDNEVPSIGFVVGSLVLVGAAGLRRRIH